MAKLTQFIINMTEDDNGHITVDNSFMVDGKEATFQDVTLNEKYNIVEALKVSLGTIAKIVLVEMGVDPDTMQKEEDKQ